MIIGLAGNARSGKNTVADFLGKQYHQKAFADAIRDALIKLNPRVTQILTVADVVEEHGWDDAKVLFPEIRRLLQVMGTEVGRHIIHQDVWLDITLRGVLSTDDVVITDVRFRNEALAIKKLGGQVWKVERDGVEPLNDHASEHALKDWTFDRIIENNSTIEQLQKTVQAIAGEFL
jgi:hypothetical protein